MLYNNQCIFTSILDTLPNLIAYLMNLTSSYDICNKNHALSLTSARKHIKICIKAQHVRVNVIVVRFNFYCLVV